MTSFKTTLASLSLAAIVAVTGVDASGGGFVTTSLAAAQTKNAASDLRVALNQLLAEHASLAAAATNAALRGRGKEFEAAAWALDMNSQDIAKAIGSVYGMEAGDAFLPLWRKHIGFVVDYTKGKAAGSQKMQDKAVNELVVYANDFGAFLNSATPSLPKDAVAELVKMHILSLKGVIDAQAARDQKLAYTKLREATHHMQMIADPLADAIAGQFPDKFPAM